MQRAWEIFTLRDLLRTKNPDWLLGKDLAASSTMEKTF